MSPMLYESCTFYDFLCWHCGQDMLLYDVQLRASVDVHHRVSWFAQYVVVCRWAFSAVMHFNRQPWRTYSADFSSQQTSNNKSHIQHPTNQQQHSTSNMQSTTQAFNGFTVTQTIKNQIVLWCYNIRSQQVANNNNNQQPINRSLCCLRFSLLLE